MFPLTRDSILFLTLKSLAGISVVSLLFIIFYLVIESSAVLYEISFSQYFFDSGWHPNEGQFLLLPMIVGTLSVTIDAMLLTISLGVFTAILCQFYAPLWLSQLLQRIVEILSGIPSVVYGFWGVVVIVPLLATIQAPGTSLLAGIVVLTFIVMPGLVLIANTAFQNVDKMHL